jgi:hypothetical protein
MLLATTRGILLAAFDLSHATNYTLKYVGDPVDRLRNVYCLQDISFCCCVVSHLSPGNITRMRGTKTHSVNLVFLILAEL